MAQVDSGLGWSCNETYYIHDKGTLIADYNRYGTDKKSYKYLDGGAVVVGVYSRNVNKYNVRVISTIDGYAKFYNPESYTDMYCDLWGSYLVNGLVWYMYDLHASTADRDNIPFPIAFDVNDFDNNPQVIVEHILGLANVRLNVNKVPTLNYVHEYVEGVVKQNNELLKLTNAQLANLRALL